jgi:hypothetical protein
VIWAKLFTKAEENYARSSRMLSLVAGLALASAVIGCGQAPSVDRIEIVEKGLYRVETARATQAAGTATGVQDELANVKLVSDTTTIPARIGTSFGLRYRVVGGPNRASVKLTVIVRFPGEGLRNPKTGERTARDVTSWTRHIGGVTYNGYGFDEAWELVPGTWTYEIWHDGRKLAEQSFTVVKS